MAAQSSETKNATLNLINDQVPGLVSDAIASDTTVADAAALAASAAVDEELDTSPRIPRIQGLAGMVLAEVDLNGVLSRGIRTDGTQVIPAAEIGGGVTRNEALADLSWVPAMDSQGRLPELVLDRGGRVPQWVLDAWSSRMGSGPSAPLDIVIVAGQSNATKRSSLPVTTRENDSRVWESTDGTAMYLSSGVPWLGSGFGRGYAKNTGRGVLLVHAASGSSGFSSSSISPAPSGYHYSAAGTWDSALVADPINLYEIMITRALAALALVGTGGRIVGVLWSQGEEDRSAALADPTWYKTKLDALIAETRSDLGIADLPFIIGSLTPENVRTAGGGGPVVDSLLEDTPRRVVRTSYVPGPAGLVETGGDGIHWAPQGQEIRGHMMAGAGLDQAVMNVVAAAPLPPQNLRVTRSGTAVVIKWDSPPARVTSFIIETSTNSGSSWSPVTLAGPVVHKHSLTVTASTPLWVRGSAVNEVGTSFLTEEIHS
jgi:hypothetical protein